MTLKIESSSFPELSEVTFAAPNDIKHNLSLVGSFQWKDFQFALISNRHSGLPFTKPSGIEAIYDEDDDETYYVVEYESLNEDRLKAYSRIDLSVNYRPKFTLLGRAKVDFSLSVLNLLKRENVFAREYYVDLEDTSETPNLAFINKSLLQRTPLVMCRIYW